MGCPWGSSMPGDTWIGRSTPGRGIARGESSSGCSFLLEHGLKEGKGPDPQVRIFLGSLRAPWVSGRKFGLWSPTICPPYFGASRSGHATPAGMVCLVFEPSRRHVDRVLDDAWPWD